LQAAEKLVRKQGYEAVTIALICDEADIAPRTFFAYFPSKEAVFFYEKQQLHDSIAEKLMSRPEGQTTFQALRELLSPAIDQYLAHSHHTFIENKSGAKETNQQLEMYDEHLSQQFETTFQECLARDLNESVDSLSVKLAAASTKTTLESIMSQQNIRKAGTNKQEIIETLDKAIRFLEAGIATLRNSDNSR